MNLVHFYIVLAASLTAVLSWEFFRNGGGR
jgi:hypothetical protein